MPRTARNRLITDNLPLVGYLANTVERGTLVTREELASAGALALVMAADSFDAQLGVPFGAYARRRILGAFLDEMRAHDWATRSIRKRVKDMTSVREDLTKALGRAATVDEMAMTLGVSTAMVTESLADASRTVMSFGDDPVSYSLISSAMLPDEAVELEERRVLIADAVEALPERMKFIVRAVYFEDRTVKSIAEELGVSHSAVSQQRSQAVRLLSEGLKGYFSTREQTPTLPPVKLSTSAKDAYLDRLATKSRRFARTLLPQQAGV